MNDKPTITLGGMELATPAQKINRFSCMIWGSSGSGKTTLASTAPGDLLWINFDPDGTDAIAYRDNVLVMDYANEPDRCVEKFKEADPLRITQFLVDHPNIQTVVFDSLTTFGNKALSHGVVKAAGTPKGRSATLEDPGYGGYGNKNTWTHLAVTRLLEATGKVGRNVIFIAHEDKPVTNSEGSVLYISIMLGSSLNEQIPVKLSEIWNLTDTGKERRIAIRACRARKPMKSRMFLNSSDPEFVWNYNAETDKGEGIAKWIEQWKANSGKKIPLPK